MLARRSRIRTWHSPVAHDGPLRSPASGFARPVVVVPAYEARVGEGLGHQKREGATATAEVGDKRLARQLSATAWSAGSHLGISLALYPGRMKRLQPSCTTCTCSCQPNPSPLRPRSTILGESSTEPKRHLEPRQVHRAARIPRRRRSARVEACTGRSQRRTRPSRLRPGR